MGADLEALVSVGYGIAYLFGVIGVVLFVQIVPKVMKVRLKIPLQIPEKIRSCNKTYGSHKENQSHILYDFRRQWAQIWRRWFPSGTGLHICSGSLESYCSYRLSPPRSIPFPSILPMEYPTAAIAKIERCGNRRLFP